MPRIILFYLLFFSFAFQASAQIKITVIDSDTQQPLDSVVIRNTRTSETLRTDAQGTVTLPWELPAAVKLFKPSYGSKSLTLTQRHNNSTFELAPLNLQLQEVVVKAYEQNRRIEQVAGSIHHLSEEEIGRFDQTSLLPSTNVIPGVRLEERSPGSYRVSIRGSSIRAPFGVRNVKIYWNGMPLTEPGGDTQLNFLDLINIDEMEIIKGPAGSLYGAGTGGAMLLETNNEQNVAEAGYMAGSFNSDLLQRAYQRTHAKLQFGGENNRYGFRIAHQQADGYRDHSAFKRTVAQLSSRHQLDEDRQLSAHLLYTKLGYQIPGGLNPEQYKENRRQARPGNKFTAGSVESNASINYDVLITNLSHSIQKKNWSNQTTLYSYLHYFDHPFNLDYKKESTLGGGGRTVFQYHFAVGDINSTLTAGGEYQLQQRMALNFDNVEGAPDSLRFSDEITSGQHLIFTQADIDLTNGWLLTTGLSYNHLRYSTNRLYNLRGTFMGKISSNFDPDLAGRIGFVKSFSQAVNLHASLSQGFSPPTQDEYGTNEGSINTNLEPERGTNYEIGLRGTLLNNRLYYDATAFHFRMTQTIVSYSNPSNVTLFRNAGETRQNGIELWLDYLLMKNNSGYIRQVRYRQGYTYLHFTYRDYVQGGNDFSGNRIPGIAPHTFNSSLSLNTQSGISLQADWQYVDQIPLNDENSFSADSYHLLRAKVAYSLSLGRFSPEIFLGSENLLNAKYSLGNDINPFGNRFFQPAAERSFFTGIRVEFR